MQLGDKEERLGPRMSRLRLKANEGNQVRRILKSVEKLKGA